MTYRILLGVLAGISLCLGQEADSAQDVQMSEGTGPDSLSVEQPAPLAMPEVRAEKAGKYSDLKSTQTMFFALDEGQAAQGVYSSDTTSTKDGKQYLVMNKLWQQKMVIYFTQDFAYRERFRFIASIECDLRFSIYS